MRQVPVRLDSGGRPKPFKHNQKFRKPRGFKAEALAFWAVDVMERGMNGIRRYILTIVNPMSRMAFEAAVPENCPNYN